MLATLLVLVLAGGTACALGRGPTTVVDEPSRQAAEAPPSGQRPSQPPPSPAPRREPAEPLEARAAPQAGQERPPLPPLPIFQLEEAPRRSELDTQTFMLLFSEPLPINDLLLRLVRATDLSVVADPDVEGTFVGELKNVTFRQALDLVLRPLDLEYSVQDTFIRVFKRRMETRIFEVNYVPTRRVARRSLTAGSADPGPEPASVGGDSVAPRAGVGDGVDGSWTQVTASENGDLFQELAGGVRTLLSEDGKFNLDRKAALLQVTDFPDRLEKVGVYLETVQTRAQRQVQIQGSVLEIALHDEYASGIDWPAALRDASATAARRQDLTPSGLTMGLKVNDVDELLRALSNQGTVTVLSRPRVVAMNNEPVVMRVGTRDVFFVTTSQVDATGRVLQRTMTPHTVTEGVVLMVTPQISAGGIVSMSISPRVTEATGEVTSRVGDTVPILSVRETDTLVRVRQGETVVMAGLMLERTRLRGSREDLPDDPQGSAEGVEGKEESGSETEPTRTTSDLVILLTPTVVTLGASASQD